MNQNPGSLPYELKQIVDDINRCISAKLYYPALAITLTLPEICSGLTLDPTEEVRGAHYKAFMAKYSKEDELGLDGEACYFVRCGLIHKGTPSANAKLKATNVVFTVPETEAAFHGIGIHFGDDKRIPMLDLKLFCKAMELAVDRWYLDNAKNPKVARNITSLLSWKLTGNLPAITGRLVLASGEV